MDLHVTMVLEPELMRQTRITVMITRHPKRAAWLSFRGFRWLKLSDRLISIFFSRKACYGTGSCLYLLYIAQWWHATRLWTIVYISLPMWSSQFCILFLKGKAGHTYSPALILWLHCSTLSQHYTCIKRRYNTLQTKADAHAQVSVPMYASNNACI